MSRPSIDVESAISAMSKEDRDICYMLAQGYSKKEIAEGMGIDRSTLYRKHVKVIRVTLAAALKATEK